MSMVKTLTLELISRKAAVEVVGGATTGRSPEAGSAMTVRLEPFIVKFWTVTCSL